MVDERIRIGVSACLVGERVRFDGGHKRQSFVAGVLAREFELLPICPEVAIGLGVPRQPIRLRGAPQGPRAVGVEDAALDVTDALAAFGRATATTLGGISGYVFKSKSPSCGLWRVKLYRPDDSLGRDGRGLYAGEIVRALPLLPAVEEGGLARPEGQAAFIARVYAFRRWQELLAAGLTAASLAQFHAAHELVLLARGRESLRPLARLIANRAERPLAETAQAYGEGYMKAMGRPATRRRQSEALRRLLAGVDDRLDAAERSEAAAAIDAYRAGELALAAPLGLLGRHVGGADDDAARRLYLDQAKRCNPN